MRLKNGTIFLIFCIIILVLLLIFDKPYNEKWYYFLNNNYMVCGDDLDTYVNLIKKDSKNITNNVVSGFVVQFKYNENYIFVKIANLCEKTSKDHGISCSYSIEKAIAKETFRYAIVNTLTGKVDDFLTEQAFNEKIKDIDFSSDWIKTKPIPEGATFGE